jgi:hypothetical protein
MKTRFFAIALMSCLTFFSQAASAKGCLKGAAVGGVGGHVVGGHGVAGAAVGCAVGRHRANKKDKQEAAQANASSTANAPAQTNGSVPAK